MTPILPYLLAVTLIVAIYLWRNARRERHDAATRRESIARGLHEPASLHPVVDPHRCIGSAGCVHACPEGALGIVKGKAVLVNGAACIGHGACKAACPMDAISLVFGTESRGVDIPSVSPSFESNVPGLFIAGELGGMGLIHKAAEQGRQAMEALRQRQSSPADLDAVIVGAGPAGLSAGLTALEHGLRFRLIEQEDSLGGTVYHYPRHKIAMTAPVRLSLVGSLKLGDIRKEDLLALWQDIQRKTGLPLHFRERMEGIERQGDTFWVVTNRGRYHTRSVLLAVGRRGTPRKLDAPGEDAAKVAYRLIDPQQYQHQAVLVVGGGDSALEAAVALAAEPGTRVTLAYRGEAFSRAKPANREAVERAVATGKLDLALGTQVLGIEPEAVVLQGVSGQRRVANNAVIVCAGGELPTALLQRVGIAFETKFGAA